jgi:hypothetical protein
VGASTAGTFTTAQSYTGTTSRTATAAAAAATAAAATATGAGTGTDPTIRHCTGQRVGHRNKSGSFRRGSAFVGSSCRAELPGSTLRGGCPVLRGSGPATRFRGQPAVINDCGHCFAGCSQTLEGLRQNPLSQWDAVDGVDGRPEAGPGC